MLDRIDGCLDSRLRPRGRRKGSSRTNRRKTAADREGPTGPSIERSTGERNRIVRAFVVNFPRNTERGTSRRKDRGTERSRERFARKRPRFRNAPLATNARAIHRMYRQPVKSTYMAGYLCGYATDRNFRRTRFRRSNASIPNFAKKKMGKYHGCDSFPFFFLFFSLTSRGNVDAWTGGFFFSFFAGTGGFYRRSYSAKNFLRSARVRGLKNVVENENDICESYRETDESPCH